MIGDDMTIVDAHHHIWRLEDLPWLNGPIVPRIFGPYEAIQRDYPVEEYRAEAAAVGVDKSVYVQVNWPLDRSTDEVRWVQQVADNSGWPHGIVASADMFDPACADTFAEQAETSSLVKGQRLQLHWHEQELYRFAPSPNEMDDPVFRSNMALLPQYDWLFELQVFSPQMADAERLVADFEDTTFVLVHAGMLESTEPAAIALWERGMEQLAAHENVVVKLTGLGTFVRGVDQNHIAMVVDRCLDWFGPRRCMWGSNFPVEKLWTDYESLFSCYREIFAAYDQASSDAVFGQTASRVYRL
jgi:predicted TIM-barrel fold metal-dependent hydrolase